MTSLVFLDIDGVLVNAPMLMLNNWPHKADPTCVDALNHILNSTGSDIVVSSSWRIGRTVSELRELLAEWGVKGQVIGKTPYMWEHKRGREIGQFLLDFGSLPFVILDDDNDMETLSHCLVQTSFDTGLTFADAERAIELLQQAGVSSELTRGLSNGR